MLRELLNAAWSPHPGPDVPVSAGELGGGTRQGVGAHRRRDHVRRPGVRSAVAARGGRALSVGRSAAEPGTSARSGSGQGPRGAGAARGAVWSESALSRP
jgi:hypothetical protein